MKDNNGLYYMRARYYSPEVKRFISQDTFEGKYDDALNINLYEYANNNPAKFVDPTGHFAESGWDIVSLGLSIAEFSASPGWRTGLAMAFDAIATAVPGVPGGAGYALKAGKFGNKLTKNSKKVKLVKNAKKASKGTSKSKIFWGSWSDYKKVKVNGQEYAKVGDRLYTKHAVDRMQPSGNRYGSQIYQAGGDYGRGVAPEYVEAVIKNGKRVLQENGNYSYTSGSLQVITNKAGAVVTIITK